MKGSLIVVGFFILGLVAGRMDALPAWMAESGLSFVALCGLLLCVGMSIGLTPDMKSDFKSPNPGLALLPMAPILLGGDGGIIHPRGLTDCLAIDSGFAYYSLSSIFITEYRGAELGTIALLTNIIREMITLLMTPLMAKWFGPLAPISSGGATTMDTTLPIITQTIGQRYVALSIFHGFATDFSVPFLVTMWCMLGA